MDRCVFCGGDVKEDIVTLDLRVGNRLLVIEDVPAEVCQKCGEKTFSPETTKMIQVIARDKPTPIKEICVPVVSLKEAA